MERVSPWWDVGRRWGQCGVTPAEHRGDGAGVAVVLAAERTLALLDSHLLHMSPGSRQPPSSEPCASGSSHSKSFDQLKCGQYLCSGDTTDSVSVTSAGSSSSDVEEINISFIPESPDCQEKKVRGSSQGWGLQRQVWLGGVG